MAAETATTPTLEQQEPSRTKETNIIAGSIEQVVTMMSNSKEPRQELKAAGPNKVEEGKSSKPNDGYEGLKPVRNGNNQSLLSRKLERTLRQSNLYHYEGIYDIKPHDKDTEVYTTCDSRTDANIEEEQDVKENKGKQATLNIQPSYIIRKPRQPPKPPPIRPKPPWTAIDTIRRSTKMGRIERSTETNRESKEGRISTTKKRKHSINKSSSQQTSQNNNSYISFHNNNRDELAIQVGSRPAHLQADPTHPAPKSCETCKARRQKPQNPSHKIEKANETRKVRPKKQRQPSTPNSLLRNSSHKATTMSTTMSNSDNVNNGEETERAGTKRSQKNSPARVSTAATGKEVTPGGSSKKSDTGARSMDVDNDDGNDSGAAKTLFEEQVEKLAKEKSGDKEKEGEDKVDETGKKGGSKVQMTVEQTLHGGYDTAATYNFSAQRKKGEALIDTVGDALHTVVKIFGQGLGTKSVGFLPVKEGGTKKPLTATTLGPSGSQGTITNFAASKNLDIPLNDPKSVKMFQPKKNAKAETVTFTCIVGYNHLSKGKWGEIYKNLRKAGIQCEIKEHPAVNSKKGIIAARIPPKLPEKSVVEPMQEALTKVVKKYCRDNNLPNVSKEIVVRVNKEYPPQIWDKDSSYLSDSGSKRLYTIEYPTEHEVMMLSILKEWRDECRPLIGRKMFFWAKPDMDGEGLESRKVAYRTHTKQSAISMDVLVYVELPGFQLMNHFGLDAPLQLETKDGQSFATTARKILMDVELPRKNKSKQRFLFYALVQTENGVDAVVPKSEDYLNGIKNIAASPAGYILFRLLTKLNVTPESIESNIGKVFDIIAVKMAKNCAHYDEASDRITMSFGVGKDTLQTPEEREILEEDWVEQAMEASKKLAESNATDNGVLYDYDDEDSDVGSVSTQVFNERTLGFDFGTTYEELVQANTEDDESQDVPAQQAETTNDDAPQPEDGFVGREA